MVSRLTVDQMYAGSSPVDHPKLRRINLKLKKYLKESSLSRLYKHMQEHDAGIITAFRDEERDDAGNVVKTYTKKENQSRNARLQIKIWRKYRITEVRGAFIQNYGSEYEKEVGENSFFVVDTNDYGGIEKDLKRLGQEFNQDSIMFIPKGSLNGILWGTKKDEFSDNFVDLKFGQKKILKNAVWGKESQFITRIKGRPFYFTESVEAKDIICPKGWFANLGFHLSAKESGIECKKEIV